MSQSQPTSSFPPPPSTSTAPLQSAASEVSEGSSLSAAPLTLESLASAIIDINRNIASMQAAWAELVQQPSPPSFSTPPLSTGVTAVSSQPLLPPSSFPYGMPVSGPGVPLNLLRWPASPSPIPAWAMGSAAPPVFATTVTQAAAAPAPSSAVPQVLSGGVDASLPGAPTAADQSAIFGAQAAPKFYKLEFPTYDGSVDPLNWLNQCEQFFRGQQTMASQRTWLASYHMKGAAQTWYYALEQDEGMPHWERFRELCSLRFGPAVQGTRLAELARLPFLSTVQDYSERYNAVLCHARDLSPRQKAELYVGGLPEQIKVHVEMRTTRDLQSAMYLVWQNLLNYRAHMHLSLSNNL